MSKKSSSVRLKFLWGRGQGWWMGKGNNNEGSLKWGGGCMIKLFRGGRGGGWGGG